MMPSAKQIPRHAVTKPIRAIVIPFDETNYLPADVEIQFRDGQKLGVASISQQPHNLYPDVTVIRARFGEKNAEFIVDITMANAVLAQISRKRGGN